MSDLFNYNTSWLNPGLKILVIVLFLFVAVIYFRSRRHYAGDLHLALTVLFWMGTFAAVAALLRYLGHGTGLGFTKEFSLKWFQSISYVVQAITFAIAGWMFAEGITPELKD